MADLQRALKEAFDIDLPTSVQELTIQAMLSAVPLGKKFLLAPGDADAVPDVIVHARTGSGKTLAFLVPILQSLLASQMKDGEAKRPDRDAVGTTCLVVVPTRELAVQTGVVLDKLLAKLKGPMHWIVSGVLSGGDKKKSEKARLRKTLHIVVATPGRLLDHLDTTQGWAEGLKRSLRWIVIDEADRLMDMGFEKKMAEVMTKIGCTQANRMPQIVLVSATVKRDTQVFAGVPLCKPIFVTPSSAVKSKRETSVEATNDSAPQFVAPAQLSQKFVAAPTRLRLAALLGLTQNLFKAPQAKAVIFCLCCDEVDYLHELLKQADLSQLLAFPTDVQVRRLHGNLEQAERAATFKAFTQSKDQKSLLICTDIAARGLNLDRVTAIIQWDAPCDVNDYLHRAGRTARQAESGQSFLFLMPSEKEYAQVLRGRGMTIGSASWDPLVRWVQAVKLPKAVKKDDRKGKQQQAEQKDKKDAERNAEEAEEEEGDQDLRRAFGAWQAAFESAQEANPKLSALAKTAYLATVRAYATHPAPEKAIFHVKKLHLGHLAASFGLAEPPTSYVSSLAKAKSKAERRETKGKPHAGKANGKAAEKGKGKGKQMQQQSDKDEDPEKRFMRMMHKRAAVSEFGAGNVGELMSSKRAKK